MLKSCANYHRDMTTGQPLLGPGVCPSAQMSKDICAAMRGYMNVCLKKHKKSVVNCTLLSECLLLKVKHRIWP